MGILKVLLYLVLITLPMGVVIRIPIFSSVYIYPIDLSLILLLTTTLIIFYTKRINPVRLPLFAMWYFFIIWGLFSLFINGSQLTLQQFFISSLYGLRLVMYSLPVFIIPLLNSSFQSRYKIGVQIAGISFVVLGIIQYIFYQNLKNLYYLGWDEHMYRLFSTVLDPNFAGAMLVLILLYGITQWFEHFKNTKMRIFLGFVLCLNGLSILLTYSRSSFVMLFISLVAYFILIKKKTLILVAFGLILLGYFFIPRDFHIENMNLFRTESVKGRLGSYQNALTIWGKSPIYGVGFNSYRYIQRKYNLLDIKYDVTHAGSGVSNSYLLVLTTTGVLGLGLFIYVWTTFIFYEIPKVKTKQKFYLHACVLASIIGIAAHSLFENTFFFPFVMVWLFILLGLYFSPTKNKQN